MENFFIRKSQIFSRFSQITDTMYKINENEISEKLVKVNWIVF